MAYDRGKLIRPFDSAKGPSRVSVRIGGERRSVEIRHVSRETLQGRPECRSIRAERRACRKVRMRLRKLRGWR